MEYVQLTENAMAPEESSMSHTLKRHSFPHDVVKHLPKLIRTTHNITRPRDDPTVLSHYCSGEMRA